MADTTYDEVPQHGQFRQDLNYKVTEDDAVVQYQAVAFGATPGLITSATVATEGRAAGFAQKSCTAAETDYSGDGAAATVMPTVETAAVLRNDRLDVALVSVMMPPVDFFCGAAGAALMIGFRRPV